MTGGEGLAKGGSFLETIAVVLVKVVGVLGGAIYIHTYREEREGPVKWVRGLRIPHVVAFEMFSAHFHLQ